MTLAPAPTRSGEIPQSHVWTAGFTGTAPAHAAGLRIGSVLRVAVLELPARPAVAGDDVLDALRRSRARSVAGAAEVLAALAGHGARPSVAVADIAGDGTLRLSLRDAPPAIILSPDRPARTATAGGEPVLSADDALLLCSASLLESPPAALATLRGATAGPGEVEDLRRMLALIPNAGATALVRRRPALLLPATA
jgi:hypothetical protein